MGPRLGTPRFGLAAVLAPDGSIYAIGCQATGLAPVDPVEALPVQPARSK